MWELKDNHTVFLAEFSCRSSLTAREGYREQADADHSFNLPELGLCTTQLDAEPSHSEPEENIRVSYANSQNSIAPFSCGL